LNINPNLDRSSLCFQISAEDPQLAKLEEVDLLAMLDDIEGIDRHGDKSSDIIIIILV